MTDRIEKIVPAGELQGVKLFVLTENFVFESVFNNVTSKRSLLFEIVLMLYQFNMKGELVLQIVNILQTWINEVRINGFYTGKNLGVIMRGLNNLQFVTLGQANTEIPYGVDPWMGLWWGNNLIMIGETNWFE